MICYEEFVVGEDENHKLATCTLRISLTVKDAILIARRTAVDSWKPDMTDDDWLDAFMIMYEATEEL